MIAIGEAIRDGCGGHRGDLPREQVEKVHAAWGMWAKPAANGQFDHPSRVFLVDGRGRVREIYNLDFFKPSWVLEDVQSLLKEAAEGPEK